MDNQIIKISDRKEVYLTNVDNVISFNENEFLVETHLGTLKVLGKNLSIDKMDTDKKELNIKGSIDSISYVHSSKEKSKDKKESVFAKLFK
jgi:sporulation protein YabP